MKAVFLFMAQGNAPTGSTPDNWQPTQPCADYYHTSFAHEGYFKLVQHLLVQGVLNELYVFYESNRAPGLANWVDHPRAHCAVIPEIRFAEKYIDDDTVLFVRGGFKHWLDWLMQYKGRNWIILYAANTGRQRWPNWDIVLDDIDMQCALDQYNRLRIPFVKPIDDTFYCPTPDKAKYDIMIGASHVHDKKGQWRVLEIIKEYQKIYNRRVRAVLPGAPRRGVRTLKMLHQLPQYDIDVVGHVDKNRLKQLYNQSRIAMFMGAHGQNDRGPLEALACGTPIMLGSPDYHSIALRRLKGVFCVNHVEHYQTIARVLAFLDSKDQNANKTQVAMQFRKKLGFDVSMEQMSYVFGFIRDVPPDRRNKEALRDCFRRVYPW